MATAAGAIALSGCGSDASSDDNDAPAYDGPSSDPCEGQAPGTACTWLGIKADEGFNGDGHPRWQTRLNQVQDLVFLADGTAWFTDFNNYLVRKVKTDGTVVSVVGWTDPVFPGDGPPGGPRPEGASGDLWQLNHPTNLLAMPDGSVLLAAWHNHKLLTIDPASGLVKVVCGSGAGFAGDGGPASKALFKQPNDVTIDEDGNLYVEDQQNWRVRKIDTNDDISTIAGVGAFGTMGDGGPANMAQFAWAFGSNPNPSGGIVYHDGKLYIADTEANRVRVIDLATGTVDALAGTGDAGFAGDGGQAKAAKLRGPRDLEIGPEGDLYIADTDNGAVRAVNLTTGIIRTVVGTGELGVDDEEQLPATQTHLRRPFGIAFDPDGNLYVMDTLNDRIVKVAK
jgi:sugar lactone lactonase YvrE